jgi:spore coat protein U-like protein
MLAIKKIRGRNMRMTTGLGVLAGLAFVGGPAAATTSIQQSFQVTLTIVAQCVINSTATMGFGNSIGVLGGSGGTDNNDQTTTVAVQCTNTTPYDIGLDGGVSGGSTTTRLLKGSGSATVQYKLYQDSGHATNWGNAVGTDTLSKIGNGASQSYTIYGRIPPQTTPAPDSYSDTVTVTVTY